MARARMRPGLQPPSGTREPPALPSVAAARVEVPPPAVSDLHREPLEPGAPRETPLSATLARAVLARAPTRAAEHVRASDRVAFKYVWSAVEADVGNTSSPEDIYDAFVRTAEPAQQSSLFFSAVQRMFDQIDDLIAAYVDGATIDQMADDAGF